MQEAARIFKICFRKHIFNIRAAGSLMQKVVPLPGSDSFTSFFRSDLSHYSRLRSTQGIQLAPSVDFLAIAKGVGG